MLPSNWDNITLEQYVEYYKTKSENPTTDEGRYQLLLKRMCILTDLEFEYIDENLTMSDIVKMDEFMKMELPQTLILDFVFKDKRYKAEIDPTKYKGGRLFACMNTLKDEDKRLDNMHRTIFNVCQLVDKKGKPIDLPDDEMIANMEEFRELPLSVANPLYVFFCSLSETLQTLTLTYSLNKIQIANQMIQEEMNYLAD